MIAKTKRYDPMASFVEKPEMLPRVSLTEEGDIRMPYVAADGKQRCILIGSERNLNYLELSIIEVRAQLAQRRIDKLNRSTLRCLLPSCPVPRHAREAD
jgi:hypothetical protein